MQLPGRIVALVLACAAIMWPAQPAHTQEPSCLVSTSNGPVQGADRGSSCAFLGIPFAAPPVAALRWRPPQPANPWTPTVRSATVAAASCAQLNAASGLPSGSEDCLTLNVWTPKPAVVPRAPVMVFLHGGSFVNASSNFPGQNGQSLAALTGVVVVAPNYRLGPFGFVRHPALAAEGEGAGNYGLLDQRAALAWVRDNIAAFGGDPNNVTLAGQSAGAHSVSLHLVSPGSAGLFHRAIMESGFATSLWRTAGEAESQGHEFADRLGCTSVDATQLAACLRLKTRDQVLLALPPSLAEQLTETERTQWTPSVDGSEIPDQPRNLYESGAFARVPTLLGANRDEGWTFVNRSFPSALSTAQYEEVTVREFGADAATILHSYPAEAFASPKDALVQLVGDVEYVCEARRLARLVEATRTPVFLYSFEHEIDPVVPDRVVHGMELNFVFGNNFGPPLFASYAFGAADVALSNAMGGYWSRFMTSGSPNTDQPDVVHWPAFKHPNGRGIGSGKYLVLAADISERLRFGARCDVWEPYFFRSVTGSLPASR